MAGIREAPVRGSYRHGELRKALIEAGLSMAAAGGGPKAVVLREATRRAGVSPNAAYRHFTDRQALLVAVSAAAQAKVADRIQQELDRTDSVDDATATARNRLRAIGLGYLAFAREQPGLFRVAFTVPDDMSRATDPSKAGTAGFTPFQLLADALDGLVAAGALPTERRANAEFLAWSAVHGLAMLVIDGPLRGLDDSLADATTQRLLTMVDRGL
ncbi:TetR/AcrR family transcriptional regulator [Parafrigoribacterium mesophilum]|uniref:TetR/AcrR family transcriptional regulator n=1 Tax=Parafrigoribacterium mesophilum TaxID=433646 RepID=UPI0031FD4A86